MVSLRPPFLILLYRNSTSIQVIQGIKFFLPNHSPLRILNLRKIRFSVLSELKEFLIFRQLYLLGSVWHRLLFFGQTWTDIRGAG